ncbi:MAG TPA: tetratricopeptide repeat protein [Polyangia bacterium]|nr:tetratricopeptide repeat protein [Polyangia bacterium]
MTRRTRVTTFALAVAAAAGAPARNAWADPTTVTAQPPPPAPSVVVSPAQLLSSADAAVDAGNLDAAAGLYDQIAREYPDAPEANEARRALKIIAIRHGPAPAGAFVPPAPSPPGTTGVVVRREPYSLRTSERLRLTTWEKLDFGTTAFLYGMSVGFSFTLSQSSGSQSVAPIALGAIAYTVGAVAYLNAGNPDRGDLPLALGITSFVPMTSFLLYNIGKDKPNAHTAALITAGTGLASVPVAIVAAHNLDLDPGDTQLVRDAGFWGLVLGSTGMLAFGGSSLNSGYGTFYQGPSDRKIFTSGLLGLWGGLGLGAVAAANSEVSLERVRVTTWGGYGGAVIGLLLGASADNSQAGAWKGISIGALAGLVITFACTGSLDGIPPEDVAMRAPRRESRFAPTFLSVTDADGRPHTAFGFAGNL